MRIRLLAVGERMPAWVETGFAEYRKRMPRDMALELEEVPVARRARNASPEKLCAEEGQRLLARLKPSDYVIALDVRGKSHSTETLSRWMADWRMQGRDVALLVGGPDGLSPEVLGRADARWSLSELTLPHPLVRVVLAEQLYRAWTLMSGHPYHRG
ncbi:MAG: 23S rRNA (pseudouridine(1915)-N(3))-methyltransferase RlmH [Gammaproteobacteria bacterium]|nr:MAG: 23S rRNA (pseudouridine(1915)-N(3))-methyltransferase RlmH [Gammaproteobacteria bacterium]